MIKYRYLILIFLFVCFYVNGQNDYYKGYIVNNNNDTIYGYINNKGAKSNTLWCYFRNNINSETIKYNPDEILSYSIIDNKYYISKTIVQNGVDKKLFLEYLIDGIVDIYFYRDEYDHYFVDIGDSTLVELKNEQKEYYVNGKKCYKNSNEFVGTLKYAFKESPVIMNELNYVDLDHNSLIKIAKRYNDEICTDQQCTIYSRKLLRNKSNFGIQLGYTCSLVKPEVTDISELLNSLSLFHFINSNIHTQHYPSYGLYYRTNIPAINESFNIKLSSGYSLWKFNTAYIYTDYTYGFKTSNIYKISFHTLNNTFEIKYGLKLKSLILWGNFGSFLDIYLKQKSNNYNITYWPSGEIYEDNSDLFYPIQKNDFGIYAGIGVSKIIMNNREISLDFKYGRGIGYIEYTKTQYLSVSLSIQLNKTKP